MCLFLTYSSPTGTTSEFFSIYIPTCLSVVGCLRGIFSCVVSRAFWGGGGEVGWVLLRPFPVPLGSGFQKRRGLVGGLWGECYFTIFNNFCVRITLIATFEKCYARDSSWVTQFGAIANLCLTFLSTDVFRGGIIAIISDCGVTGINTFFSERRLTIDRQTCVNTHLANGIGNEIRSRVIVNYQVLGYFGTGILWGVSICKRNVTFLFV